MERTDKHTFYLISELMPPKDTPYLNINNLPIVRKINITNKEGDDNRSGGVSVKVESRTGISIHDIISEGCLFFTWKEEAEEIVKIMKHNGFRTAFIVELKVDATYTTLE